MDNNLLNNDNFANKKGTYKTPFKNPVTNGKLQPQALELEEVVLGALMIEKEAINDVIDILYSDTFYKPAHQEIYNAIKELFQNSEPIDIITVTQKLRSLGKLEFVGGAYVIAELTSRVNSAANIVYHSRLLMQYAIKRALITICSKIETQAFEDTTDVLQLLDAAQQSLFDISEKNIRKNYMKMKDLMSIALEELEAKKDKKDGLTGVPTGFTDLDHITSGWQRSDLIILAARPGMGKTAFVVSALRNAAVDHQKAVAIFSLEMSAIQLVNRLLSAEAELNSEKIKKGNLMQYEWEQLHSKITKLTEAPIFIDDTPALSVLELRAKARRLKAQHNIELLIVDYLQLMSGGDGGGGKGNREQEIAFISRSLKNIAKELDIPVIALSQLSRAVETRGGDKKPMLSDLRESGSIEQDADMVIFLYRPEYYKITQDESGMPCENMAEVIIAKHRNGSLDTVKLKFIGEFTKFGNLDNFGFGADTTFSSEPTSFPTADAPNQFITLASKMNDTKAKPTDNTNEIAPF